MAKKHTEHTSRNRAQVPFTGRTRPTVWWVIWGLVIWLVIGGVRPVNAQEDLPGWIPLPGPEHDPAVMLQALAVDLTVQERDSQLTLAVTVRFRLLNTRKTGPARAHIVWSGTDQSGKPLSSIRFASGTDPAAARPYSEASLVREMRPDERLWFTLTYTETLPARPWAYLIYGVDRLHEWPVTVGSVRVTLHFPERLDQRAMLRVAPDPSRYDGEIWEWQWENVVPPQAVEAVFIRPSWWLQFERWRAQADAGDIKAATALARVLTGGVIDPQAPEAVAVAFYPEALALWTQVAEARPEDPEPWRQMAALYAAQAAASPQPESYRSLVVAALEAAWARGDRDPALRSEIASAIEAQVRTYMNSQRWEEALQQVSLLADVLEEGNEERVQALRREVALAWALDRLEAGDEAGFQQAIVTGWGESMLGFFLPQRPPLRYVGVDIVTTEITRTITLIVTLDPQVRPGAREAWEGLVEWVNAQVPQGTATTRGEGSTVMLQVTFPYTSPEDILSVQEKILEGVPETPAWALVRAALAPRRLVQGEEASWWGKWRWWQEELDLGSARRALDEAISQVDMSLTMAANTDFPAALLPVLRQQRAEDREAWIALRDYSDVVLRYRWKRRVLPPLYQRWHVNAGEQVVALMRWPDVAPSRVGGLALIALLGWTLGTWGLWRWLGRG